MNAARRAAASCVGALLATGAICVAAAAGEWRPPVPSPPDNPLTAEKADLGRHLFFDPRLSGSGRTSCASCHRPARAFADPRARPVGDDGAAIARGAPSLANLAWATALTWADPSIRSLEEQARVALFGTGPVEMGARGREAEILARLAAEPRYGSLFRAAFPGDADPLTLENAVRALASFERTLVSLSSPYDRLVLFDEHDALTQSARRGMDLFFSERTACASCHSGLAFTAASGLRRGASTDDHAPYYRTRVSRPGTPADAGLAARTGLATDRGRFRVPTLRNVAVTAPYLHDGSAASLFDVVSLYDRGGVPAGADARAAEPAARPHAAVRPLGLSDADKRDLVAFLESLTDARFVADPSYGDPWTERAAPRPER